MRLALLTNPTVKKYSAAMTNLQVLREQYGFSAEEMAQIIGLPIAAYSLAEIGFRVGRRHHDRLVEFFESEWLADAVLRTRDPIVLNALGVFVMPEIAIPEQFR